MKVVQLKLLLVSLFLSFGVLAQQGPELSYEERIEIEEVHLGEHTETASSDEADDEEPTQLEHPEEMEPPE